MIPESRKTSLRVRQETLELKIKNHLYHLGLGEKCSDQQRVDLPSLPQTDRFKGKGGEELDSCINNAVFQMIPSRQSF